MRAVLFVLLALLGSALSISLEALKNLPEEELYRVCDQINDKSNQLWTPFRCVKGHEDYAAAGKKFKATHKIDAASLNPVVLLPGLGGSSLDAQVHKNDTPAWYCFKHLDWFRIWFAVEELLVQKCWMDNLNVEFDPSTGNYSNTPGVNMRPTDFGGIEGVAYLDYAWGIPIVFTGYYNNVIKSLEEIGYVAGQNLHGAPFDWRFPATFTETLGWYGMLQELIESSYSANGNLPVHVITHSMGGPTALYFLNSMPQSWLDTYIASFIPIAGPWTGSPKALRAILSGDNFGLSFLGIDILGKLGMRNIARQAGGVVELIPNTDLNTLNSSFVSVSGTNYTIADFPALFSVAGTPITTEIFATTKNLVANLHAPGVPVHCVYGYGVPTEIFYQYDTPNFDEDPIIFNDNYGDGTVPLYSLQECQRWVSQQTQPVEVKEFNLVGHSDILKDDEFLQYLLSVVTNQQQ